MRGLCAAGGVDRVDGCSLHETVVPFVGFEPMPRGAFGKVLGPLFESGGFYVDEGDGMGMGLYKVQRHLGRTAHVAYLGTLAEAPEAQGRGTAVEMMQDAISRCWRAGITRIELTVEADNPRAIAFYERLGFVHEGTQRAAYKRASNSGYVDELIYGLLRSN